MNRIFARRSRAALLLASVLIAACQATPDAANSEVSAAADIAAINEQSVRFSQAYVDGDLEVQMSIYTEDAVIAPPGTNFLAGEQLRRYWAPAPEREVVSHKTIPLDIVLHDDVAYDWGRYEGSGGPIGAPSAFWGKYLIVWRRGDDNVWRIAQDMWNNSPQ